MRFDDHACWLTGCCSPLHLGLLPGIPSLNISIAQFPCMKPTFLPLLLAIIIVFA